MARYTERPVVGASSLFIRASTEAELEIQAAAALASIPAGNVVTGIFISGTGLGRSFVVRIEYAAAEGYSPTGQQLRFYIAENPTEIANSRNNAINRGVAQSSTARVLVEENGGAAAGLAICGCLLMGTAALYTNLYATQTTWYIDATNGSDTNTGLTSGTALASHAEFQRRMQDSVITSFITVNILTDLVETLSLRAAFSGDSGAILYLGTSTSLITDTVAASQAPNDNQEGQVDGTAITDFTTYTGKLLTFTSGTWSGWSCWISGISQSAVGNEIARVGVISMRTGTGNIYTDYTVLAGNIGAPGDTYKIEDMVSVGGTDFEVRRLDTGTDGAVNTLTVAMQKIFIDAPGVAETVSRFQAEGNSGGRDGSPLLVQVGVTGTMRGDAVSCKCCCSTYENGTIGELSFFDMSPELLAWSGGRANFYRCDIEEIATGSYVDTNSWQFLEHSLLVTGTLNVWHGANGPGMYVDESSVIQNLVALRGNLTSAGASADGMLVHGKVYCTATAALTLTHDVGQSDVILGSNGGQTLAYGALPAQNTIGGGQNDDALIGLT